MNKIRINCPVILGCSLIMWGFYFLGDGIVSFLRQVPFLFDLLGNIFIHSNFDHIFNNFKYVLLLGPIIETLYGSKNLIKMILITTVAISSVYIILFPTVSIIGFSGIVYMFIGLASLIAIKDNKVPLMGVLLLLVFIGDEGYKMFFSTDNVAHLAHIMGSVCGVIYGLTFKKQ